MRLVSCIAMTVCLSLMGCDETNNYYQDNEETQDPAVPTPIYGPKVLDFNFDSVIGATIPDHSENGLAMLVRGCTLVDREVGKALSCQGQNSSAKIKFESVDLVKHLTDKTTVSLQFWLNYSSISRTTGTVFQFGGTYLYIQNGVLIFQPDAGINLTMHSPLTAGVWYNIAITFDGSSTKFYLDGVLVQSYDVISPLGRESFNRDFLFFQEGYEGKLSASIDSLRVYDTILTSDQIQAAYAIEN